MEDFFSFCFLADRKQSKQQIKIGPLLLVKLIVLIQNIGMMGNGVLKCIYAETNGKLSIVFIDYEWMQSYK